MALSILAVLRMTRRHPIRTQRALRLQRVLREDCPEYADAEIRHLSIGSLWPVYLVDGPAAYSFAGSPVQWDGPGWYWRTGPGKTWTLVGLRYSGAMAWTRSKARVSSGTPRKRPPSLAEVMDAVATVLGLAGAVAPMFRR